MSIATDAKVKELEGRVRQLELMISALKKQVDEARPDESFTKKVLGEIQGLKMRMGKIGTAN